MASVSPTRHVVIAKMRQAFREGMSASRFIQEMRIEGLSYRRQVMLADWRTVNEIEAKEGRMRYVRKDALPSERTLAAVEWALSQEYMYKVFVQSRKAPGEPIEEKFVSIMSDVPLRPGEVERMTFERWGDWEKYAGERLMSAVSWSGYKRVE